MAFTVYRWRRRKPTPIMQIDAAIMCKMTRYQGYKENSRIENRYVLSPRDQAP